MGEVRALFDTNILIDALKGLLVAQEEIRRFETHAISIITWMEVMTGVMPGVERSSRLFLTRFQLLQITPAIAERTVFIRKTTRLKLPDAVILATAQTENCILITRNTRDFETHTGVRIPYRL